MASDLQKVADLASSLLGQLGPLIQAGVNVMDIITNAKERFEAMSHDERGPTDEEWESVNAPIREKRKELHSP